MHRQLFSVVENGSADEVRLYLQKTKNANLTNPKGETALMKAIIVNPDAVHPLLEHGAHKNVHDEKGRTPLGLALVHRPEIAKLFAGKKCGIKPGMKMPVREQVPAAKANGTFSIKLNALFKEDETFEVPIAKKIREWLNERIADGTLNENQQVLVFKLPRKGGEEQRQRTTRYTTSTEALGFRLDADARFVEYSEFFQPDTVTQMTVTAGTGLLKLKNLLHDNWKEVRDDVLNDDDEEDVVNDDPLMSDINYMNENEVVYYRDLVGKMRLLNYDTLKQWIDTMAGPADQDRARRDLISGERYLQWQIDSLSDQIESRPDLNNVITVYGRERPREPTGPVVFGGWEQQNQQRQGQDGGLMSLLNPRIAALMQHELQQANARSVPRATSIDVRVPFSRRLLDGPDDDFMAYVIQKFKDNYGDEISDIISDLENWNNFTHVQKQAKVSDLDFMKNLLNHLTGLFLDMAVDDDEDRFIEFLNVGIGPNIPDEDENNESALNDIVTYSYNAVTPGVEFQVVKYAKLLLYAGANPNKKGYEGYPIEIAIDADNSQLVMLLLRAGASTNIEVGGVQTDMLDYAESEDKEEAVRVIRLWYNLTPQERIQNHEFFKRVANEANNNNGLTISFPLSGTSDASSP